MNGVDLALAFLLAVCALRGYWRGFFRECFGVLALVGGVAAALRFTTAGATLLAAHVTLPAPVLTGLAFVGIFVMVHTGVSLLGVILDRLARALFLRAISRAAGAALGAAKGAAVLAFVLLFLHLFPVVPVLDASIMSSTIGRPLVTAAGNVIRVGMQSETPPESRRDT